MIHLHEKQRLIAQSNKRFKVIRAGRKGGKTAYERESISYKATASVSRMPYLAKTKFDTGRKVIYIAPTQEQARNIIWEALKNRFAGIGKHNEQRLQMKVPNEDGDYTTIYVGGWENRENYRGLTDVIHITFDETDTLKDFFIAWKDIFRPMFLDTAGTADFIGTPDKRNPNLKRLEKEAETNPDYECFHFTSKDNPHLPKLELMAMEAEYANDRTSFRQEVLAEHIEDSGSLFKLSALVDMFTNTISKKPEKYQIIDVADDGSDKTTFGIWDDLELYKIEKFERMNTENIVDHIRENNAEHKIPMSQNAVDAIGVGAGVASNSKLDGIVGYKSSYAPIKTDQNPVLLPNVHYLKGVKLTSDYANLRSQCLFTLAELINNHKIAVKTEDVRIKEAIIEELSHYQDISKGDGKRLATHKEDIKAIIGRSPDLSDLLIMRMYFVLKEKMSPNTSEEQVKIARELREQFDRNFNRSNLNSGR